MSHVRLFRLSIASMLAMVWVGTVAGVASADTLTVPFTDPATNGTIGFCDRDGHQVTSGKVTDVPFVWTAVASTPAPKAYVGPLGKATLTVFQPRKDVDPGEWSGVQMTAPATYTNPQHPMAQATNIDRPLRDFTSVAPLWDGFAQVRMIYSNVDTSPAIDAYPATVIFITGGTWSAVDSGTVDCHSGTALSVATTNLGTNVVPSASPTLRAPNGKPASAAPPAGGSSAAAPSSGSAVSSAAPGATPTGGSSPSGVASTDGTTSSGDPTADSTTGAIPSAAATTASVPLWLIGVLILLPVLGVAAGLGLARRSDGRNGSE